jgi:IS605 OrfB family transposase
MVKGYLSNLKNWEFQRARCDALYQRRLLQRSTTPSTDGVGVSPRSSKKGNPPKPPTARNFPTFYSGTIKLELLDIKNQFVRLKVYDGSKWVWKNYPVKIGKKQLEQLNDTSWSMQSPTLVSKATKRGIEWYLHIPLAKKVSLKPIKEQKKENPNLTTLAVDLGLRHLAVVTVRKNGEIVKTSFFRGENVSAHRLQHLYKVFRKQKRSGKPIHGEKSNQELWRHIKATNTDVAHNITQKIVKVAQQFEVKVIVIEHLHKFQPFRGEKRSKKLNRKLTYWLKGKIEEQLRYKAFEHGILVKSVSPAFTSKICNKCGGFGERFSSGSLFRCFYCGYVANADFNASVNLHKVFWNIFPLPKRRKKPTRKGKVARGCVHRKLKRRELISLAIC